MVRMVYVFTPYINMQVKVHEHSLNPNTYMHACLHVQIFLAPYTPHVVSEGTDVNDRDVGLGLRTMKRMRFEICEHMTGCGNSYVNQAYCMCIIFHNMHS